MDEDKFIEDINGKNINFLIGSGINVPSIPTLSIGNLMFSFEDLITSEGIVNNQRYYTYFLIYFYMKTISPSFNPTDINDDELKINYRKFIDLLIFRLTTESHDKPKRINIFTTNYDLLFESTFDSISRENNQVNFNDGSFGFIKRYVNSERFHIKTLQSGVFDKYSFEIPMINLIKLHGSLSWEVDEDEILLNYEESALRHYNTIFEYSDIINTFDSMHKSIIKEKIIDILIEEEPGIYEDTEDKFLIDIDHYYKQKTEMDPSLLDQKYTLEEAIEYFQEEIDHVHNLIKDELNLEQFSELFESLVIVNPTKKKFNETVFQQHYYQMLRVLTQELERKQTVLIVFGFSFNDEHILEIVRRSSFNEELMIYIISYSSEGQEQVKTMFRGYSNVKYFPTDISNKNGDFNFLINLLGGLKNNE